MSLREGTRRKKISVLHMLGTWEGKIEGCNCPSCKDFDEEQISNKSPSKLASKAVKAPKSSQKKTVVKVKTTKVIVDKGTGELLDKKTLKSSGHNVIAQEGNKLLQDSEYRVSGGAVSEKGSRSVVSVLKSYKDSSDSLRTKELTKVKVSNTQKILKGTPDQNEGNKVICGESKVINMTDAFSEQNHPLSDLDRLSSPSKDRINNVSSSIKDLESPGQKAPNKHQIHTGGSSLERVEIKQEPDDFLSDEDELEGEGNEGSFSDWSKMSSKARKRARMVTSEVENIYAKPRMVFTGRGVVKKFEPGMDKTPKSKRGRKPNKTGSVVSVKQEPKEYEENEEHELDQLQKALSEAADNLDVGDDLLDALDEFEEESKEVKMRKKAKFRVMKRVDADGDKYVECNMCFKMLKESSMKQHQKTHTGEKPHACDECEARFTRKGDVERHKRLVHKNQKPFKCRKCKRNFSDRKNLKVHLQNHDKAIYYACNTCGFKFGKREYYENHIRYIHPLPDGCEPVFSEVEHDLAVEQLQELESEEKKERQDKEAKTLDESVYPLNNEVETIENEDDVDEADEDEDEDEEVEQEKAAAIAVTDESKKMATESTNVTEGNLKDPLEGDTVMDAEGLVETDEWTDAKPRIVGKPPLGTDVRVSRGTLSYTQTVSDTDTHDEDLVNKIIDDAISQAASTIENLQTLSGANLSGNDIEFDDYDEDDDDDDDENDEELMEEDDEDDDDFQEMLNSKYGLIPIAQEQKAVDEPSEIHISASVGGQKKKFIIQVPPGSNLNIQSPEGMEMIVSMVNQLCAGKGELDGPIEVVMQNPSTRALSLD